MVIQIDSREHQHVLTKIKAEFDRQGVKYYTSKLLVGDYMNLDNPKVIVDRKQNLQEIVGNVIHDHERFRCELIRAQEVGIQLVILCEEGHNITCLEDVKYWDNPRRHIRKRIDGRWQTVETKATTGETLYNILSTMARKYGVIWEFCTKEETGSRILEILGGEDG